MKKTNLIVLATGGSGGHLFPALSVCNTLLDNGYIVHILMDKRAFNYSIKWNEKTRFKKISSIGLHNKSIFFFIKMMFITFFGLLEALFFLIFNRPKAIISFGSYASIPSVLAGILLRIPVIMHEQNAILGKAHKIFVKYAKYLLISFKKTSEIPDTINPIFCGLPIRNDFIQFALLKRQENKKIKIGIFGGSQGAQIFSKLIPQSFLKLSKEMQSEFEVYHQCRSESLDDAKNLWSQSNTGYNVFPFFQNMPELIFNLDVIIARSGASSIYEFACLNKYVLYVPFAKSAQNHQVLNACNAVEYFGSKMVEEKDFNNEYIYNFLTNIVHNKNTILKQKEIDVNSLDCFNSLKVVLNLINNI